VSLPLPLLDLVALVFLLGGLPIASLAQLRFVDGIEIQRVPAYLGSVATLVVLGVGTWFVGAREDGASALGLGPVPVGPVVAAAAALVLSGLVLAAAFRQCAILLGVGESPVLRALMPRTARERGLFAVLSLAGRILRRHPGRSDLAGPARLLIFLVAVQILLGGAAVLTRLAVVPTTAHVVVGALLVAACLVVTVRAAPARSGRLADAPSRISFSEGRAPAVPSRAAGSAA